MWEKSEKHSAMALLFVAAGNGLSGWPVTIFMIMAGVHVAASLYYAFKEGK